MSDGQKFLNKYMQFLSNEFKIYKMGETIVIVTPFIDQHNDYIEINVMRQDDGWLAISSDSIDYLAWVNEMDDFTWLSTLAVNYKVTIEHTVVTALAKEDDFARVFHRVLSVAIILGNMR